MSDLEGGFIREEVPVVTRRRTRRSTAAAAATEKGGTTSVSTSASGSAHTSEESALSSPPSDIDDVEIIGEICVAESSKHAVKRTAVKRTRTPKKRAKAPAQRAKVATKRRKAVSASRGSKRAKGDYSSGSEPNDAASDEDYQASETESLDDGVETPSVGGRIIVVDDDDTPLAERAAAAITASTTAAVRTPRGRGTAGIARRTRRGRAPRDPRSRYQIYHDKITERLILHHPELKNVFEDISTRPLIQVEEAPQPPGMKCTLLPFQKEGLNWLVKQEQSRYHGGILADEMGMGKTIQTVALLMKDPPGCGPTIVVAPTVALIQWKNEIDLHTGGKLKVLVYHGQNRSNNEQELISHDVILTTYAVLESVYRKQQSGFKRKGKLVKEKSRLHHIEFHRIILDEAHNIKDRQSNTARAVFNMKAKYRLCLSGTPLQNRIGEIYSLLRFLAIEPFCMYYCKSCDCGSKEWLFSNGRSCDHCGHRAMDHCNFFNHSILKHIQRNGVQDKGGEAMQNMRTVLKQFMLRRTKVERADDLGLPPRIIEIRRDYFNEEEEDLYASLYSDSQRKFNTYVNQGVVLNNYANIFTLITRLRQMADHPDLVLKRTIGNVEDAENTLVCRLCDDEAEEAIKSKCHHVFCRLCIREYCEGWTGAQEALECPVCHVKLSIDLTAPALDRDETMIHDQKGSIVNRLNMSGGWRSSTKIEALVEELFRLRSDRQTIKSIVFSQFTSMLDLVEWRLQRAGFETVKLQGSMSPMQRDSIIQHFMETPSVEVFLVSLKAGGVALNLCEASQVFILDPWWNPSVEWQSGDRVHRIGQHRPVKITRLTIENSIEARIIDLQEKKSNMIRATINQDDGALNQLTPDDMQFLFMN